MSSTAVYRARATGRAITGPQLAYPLAAVLVLALVIRVVVVLATPHYVPQADAADYDRIAVSLAQHGQFPQSVLAPMGGPTAYRPPLFPLLLAGVYEAVGIGSQTTRWQSGRLLEAVLGTIAVALTFLIALRLWDRRVALISAAIAAISPPLVLVGSSVMSEPLFIVLVLAAVLTALVHRDCAHRCRWAIATAVLVGLAALTRSNGIALLIPIAFLVWTERPRLSWRSLRTPIAMIAVTLAMLVPWMIRNASELHAFVPLTTESGYGLAGTYNATSARLTRYPANWVGPAPALAHVLAQDPGANEAQISNRLDTAAFSYVEAHPTYVLKVLYWNTLRTLNLTGTGFELFAGHYEAYPGWLTVVSVYSFWVLGLLALAGACTRRARTVPWAALWGWPLAGYLTSVFLLGATRYRSPADPFLIMLAALALQAGWLRLRRPGGQPPAASPPP